MSNGDYGSDYTGTDGGGGSLVGQTLYDLQGNLKGRVVRVGEGTKYAPGLYLFSGMGKTAKYTPFAPGSYLMDAGMGKMYHVTLDRDANILKSATSTMPSGDGADGPGSSYGAYAAPQWRPGELELEQEAIAVQQQGIEQRLEEIRLQGEQEAAAAALAHQNAIKLLEMEMAHASEMQKERIQHDIDLENLKHDNDMKELGIRIEAERKAILYGEIGATGRTLIQEKGAMGRELLQLGPDPFAQAAGLKGEVTRGITPQQQAVGQAQAFINQPIPQASMNMGIPQLEAILRGIQGIQAPSAGGIGMAGPIGMAGGGVIEMEKDKDGAFSKKSVLVGEAGPEILTVGGGRVEVTPLVGAAQYGMSAPSWATPSWGSSWQATGLVQVPRPPPPSPPLVQVPVRPPSLGTVPRRPQPLPSPPTPPSYSYELAPENPLAESILQNLSPLYTGSVFGQVPVRVDHEGRVISEGGSEYNPDLNIFEPWSTTEHILPHGVQIPSVGGMSPLETLSELGIAPQLIRIEGGGTFFIQNGRRHIIPGGWDSNVLKGLGFDPAQVVTVSQADVERFKPGGVFTGRGTQAAGYVAPGPQPGYGAMGAPLVEPTSGALLPAIHKIAGNWQDMSLAEQENAASAFKAAGISPTMLQDILQTFTPAGRGYGRRIGGIGTQF